MTQHPHKAVAELPSTRGCEDLLFDVLAAYQFLQGQNIRMASQLSDRLGVASTGLRVLMFIDRSPDATPKEVAHQLTMTSGSVTALLDRLEHSGHVVRRPHPSDRRSLILALTEAGDEAVAEVRSSYRSAFAGSFPDDEVEQVAQVLHTLGNSLGRAIDDDFHDAHPEGPTHT